MKIPDTPSQVLNAPSNIKNTPSQCRRHQICQPKQQVRQLKQQVCQQKQQVRPFWFTLFCRDVIFVANLRIFLAYNLQAKKCGGVQKMTNIRYVPKFLPYLHDTYMTTPRTLMEMKLEQFRVFFLHNDWSKQGLSSLNFI